MDKQADAHAGRSPAAGQMCNPCLVSILQTFDEGGLVPGKVYLQKKILYLIKGRQAGPYFALER